MRSEPISSGDGILHACDIGTLSGNGESASRRGACAKVTWVGAKRTDAAMPTIGHALRLLTAVVAGSLGPSLAQDLDPRALAAGCATCHQASVESPPPLGGQSRDALLAKLRGFREGTRSGTVMPQLARGYTPANSTVTKTFVPQAGITEVYFSSWDGFTSTAITVTAGAQAAAATMMHSDVINEYILDAATNSATDWVFTFPVKRLFVNAATAVTPFTNHLTADGACETIDFQYFNREEATAVGAGVDFSPTPPGAPSNSLCFESSVLSFRNGSASAPSTPAAPSLVLGSQNVTAVTVNSDFQNGWGQVHFSGANASSVGLVSGAASVTAIYPPFATGAGAQAFAGLPVVGFMARTYTNGLLQCSGASCLGNYMGSVSHNYITTAAP